MDYDLEQKIAPEFIRYSLVRHRADMSFMHNVRNSQPEKRWLSMRKR